jgi:hypothetical protein
VPLLLGFSDCATLWLVIPTGLHGSFVLERLASLDELSQGIYSCLCTKERCELEVWGPFVDYVPVFLVCLAFKCYMFACLEFYATWTSDGFLYVVCLVVLSEVAVSSPGLCHYP